VERTERRPLVVVDYLQKVYVPKMPVEDERATVVVEGLKDLALDLEVPVLALSPRLDVVRRCSVMWGIHARLNEEPHDTPRLLEVCAEAAIENGVAEPGDKIGITAGLPAGKSGGTNLFKVETLS